MKSHNYTLACPSPEFVYFSDIPCFFDFLNSMGKTFSSYSSSYSEMTKSSRSL